MLQLRIGGGKNLDKGEILLWGKWTKENHSEEKNFYIVM